MSLLTIFYVFQELYMLKDILFDLCLQIAKGIGYVLVTIQNFVRIS